MTFYVIGFIFLFGFVCTILLVGSLFCTIEDKWNTYWDEKEQSAEAARNINEGKLGSATNIDARQIHLHNHNMEGSNREKEIAELKQKLNDLNNQIKNLESESGNSSNRKKNKNSNI